MPDQALDLLRAALSGDKHSILTLAAIYMFLVCGYSCIYQMRMRAWPSTVGRLSKLAVEKFGPTEPMLSSQDYAGTALYSYRVGTTEHQGSKISPWIVLASHNLRFVLSQQLKAVDVDPGGNVKVFYHPKKPHKSVLIRPGFAGLAVTFALATVPLALLLIYGGQSG